MIEADNAQAEREKRWQEMGYDALTSEYLKGMDEVPRSSDAVAVTRRHYRRYELVQERLMAGEVKEIGDSVACREGCAYCCHNRVVAPPHEVLTLAERIERLPEAERAAVMDRVARNAERVEAMQGAEAFSTPMRCALLDEKNACSVYEDRPSVCRRYHSLSLADCETSFSHPDDLTSRIRLSVPLLMGSAAHNMAFRKVLVELGRDTTDYELHTALREALADPNACGERYRRGETAFVHATTLDDRIAALRSSAV